MSTGADCVFYEDRPNEWFYKLQRHPYGYVEDYDHFGPFSTFDKAHAHLSRNHANPGGHSMNLHPNHVHSYVAGRRTSCGRDEPKTLACGCVDYHKPSCGEYVLYPKFTITADKAEAFLRGDKDLQERVLGAALAAVTESLRDRQSLVDSGW